MMTLTLMIFHFLQCDVINDGFGQWQVVGFAYDVFANVGAQRDATELHESVRRVHPVLEPLVRLALHHVLLARGLTDSASAVVAAAADSVSGFAAGLWVTDLGAGAPSETEAYGFLESAWGPPDAYDPSERNSTVDAPLAQ